MISNNWISRQEMTERKTKNTLKKEYSKNRQEIDELKNQLRSMDPFTDKGIEINRKINEISDRNEEIGKILDTVTTYADQSIERTPYSPMSHGFSFGDIVGRDIIDSNRANIVFDNYEDNNIAKIVNEGEESDPRRLNVTVLKTDSTEAVCFDDIITTSLGTFKDTPEIDEMFKNNHIGAIINAENKKAIDVFLTSKEAIPVSAENIEEAINSNLCAKAKSNSVIIVNKSGFALLDIDINGVPLVTKDPDGRFIYKNKYQIVELSDAILSNSEDGSPLVIVGDVANVLKFFLISERDLFSDDISAYGDNGFNYIVADRKIKKEIITLSTTSDEAFIVGYIV